jgi:hypothetical protein
MIYTWNGRRFEFITDVLGVAPLGASAGDGVAFPVDHDEYVRIPGASLAPVDGMYEVRIVEELREVAYIDQVRLIALDHPAATAIYTNEKFKSPPFPEWGLFGVRRSLRPVAARDERGRDLLAPVLRSDRVYATGFRHDHSGVAEMHSLTLDFGRAAPDNRAILFLEGWVDWPDGSTFRAASRPRHDASLFAGEGRARRLEDRDRRHGRPRGHAQDHRGRPHRPLSLGVARGPHRHQPLCLLGPHLPQ